MVGVKRMPRPLSESRKPESRRKIAVLRGMRLRQIDSPLGFPGQPCACGERENTALSPSPRLSGEREGPAQREGGGRPDGSAMKAAAVDYVRPRSLAEAVDLLAKHRGEARVIAGGQSLVAMMNLRVASPGLLIDISRLPELCSVSDDAEAVTLGACGTH